MSGRRVEAPAEVPGSGASPDAPETPDFAQTKEFKEAVAAAAQNAVREALDEFRLQAETLAKPPAGADDATKTLFSELALTLAQISDQGTQRKRIAPEVLAQRQRARERMNGLIHEARAAVAAGDKTKRPEYRVIGKMYLNERMLEPFIPGARGEPPRPVEIIWNGVPNDLMRPLNDTAKAIFAAYRESIGNTEKVKGVDNRDFRITAGGLIVKTDSVQTRNILSLPEGNGSMGRPPPDRDEAFADDLEFRSPHDPRSEFVNVLGTVAQPARQNTSDVQQIR